MPVSPLQGFFFCFFFLRGEVILHFFRFGSDFGPVFFSGLVSFPGFWKTIRVLQIRKN